MIDRRLVLLALVSSLLVPSADAAEREPSSIVTWIYGHKARKVTGFDSFLWRENRKRLNIFSKALLELWDKADAKVPEGDAGPFDFDPTTNSQYASVTTFRVKSDRQDSRQATVTAVLKMDDGAGNAAPTQTIRYDFVREGSLWLIDDIRGIGGSSARRILTDSLKD